MLRARDVTVTAAGRRLLADVSLELREGELLALVGPNGAGKSTLLSCLAGERAADVRLLGRQLQDWPRRQRARLLAVMPQDTPVPFGFSALEVVNLGRLPHEETASSVLARAALARVGATHLAARSFPTLSGGERRRVAFARALVQLPSAGPRVLLLDEPTAGLDLRHQHELMALARDEARAGAAVLVVLHDLALAARYAGRVAVLAGGRLLACGPPAAVLSPGLVASVFGVSACRIDHPMTGETCLLVSTEESCP